MSRRRVYIAIAVLAIYIVLTLLQANASLVPEPFGFGGNTNSQSSQANTIIPLPTQAQKDEAIKIASTSPLCKQYNAYPNENWNFGWNGGTPAGNIINLMAELPDTNWLEIVVDLNTDSIVSATIDPSWGTDYAYPVNSTNTNSPQDNSITSLTGTTSTMPLLFGSFMSYPASSTPTINSATTSSLPFNMFSTGLNAFPSLGMNALNNNNEQSAMNAGLYTPQEQDFAHYW